nr:MAG TPA: hypothetical protein [Caudoviricetes sp.]
MFFIAEQITTVNLVKYVIYSCYLFVLYDNNP